LKLKTKSGAKKRFKVSANNKIIRKRAGHRHLLECQSSKRGRRLRKKILVSNNDMASVRRMLGIGSG